MPPALGILEADELTKPPPPLEAEHRRPERRERFRIRAVEQDVGDREAAAVPAPRRMIGA
ncbi:MAG TPA: hypothetical protein VGK63_01540 [Candidatus Limnocylindrales bacterium]